MADGGSDRSTQEKDMRYNVEVAKRMTVPDEIRLTGPSRPSGDRPKTSSAQPNYQLAHQTAQSPPHPGTNQERANSDKKE